MSVDLVQVRLKKERTIPTGELTSPEKVARFIANEFGDYDREIFGVINLTCKGQPINTNIVGIGLLSESLCHPREVFKSSILSNAASAIVFHNHPSGDLTPSEDDIKTTKRLKMCGDILGIRLLDHIIINSKGEYKSLREKTDLLNEVTDTSSPQFTEFASELSASVLAEREKAAESGIKITRVIEGVAHEFTLTREELFDAYIEQEKQMDKVYVLDNIWNFSITSATENLCGMLPEEIEGDPKLVGEIAGKMRNIADKECIPDYDALEKALKEILPQYEGKTQVILDVQTVLNKAETPREELEPDEEMEAELE